jgi:amino acid transporter
MSINFWKDRAKNWLIAFLMAYLIFFVAMIATSSAEYLHGVFFPNNYPVVGRFAVIDWLGIFMALAFLAGWISYSLAMWYLSRFAILSGLFGQIAILAMLVIVYGTIILLLHFKIDNHIINSLLFPSQIMFNNGVLFSMILTRVASLNKSK